VNGSWNLKIPFMEIYTSLKAEDTEVSTLASSISDNAWRVKMVQIRLVKEDAVKS
jgi:hypothetical protein